MFCTIHSCGLIGMDTFLARVEVDAGTGLPAIDMVGLLNSEVKESKERVKIALKNCGYRIPPQRITVNIAPADKRKEGTAFDLPIAIGIMQSLDLISSDLDLTDTIFLGELGLDGEIRSVKGVLPITKYARDMGYRRIILPIENAEEGAVIEGIKVVGVENLLEVASYLEEPPEKEDLCIDPTRIDTSRLFAEEERQYEHDFANVYGQETIKRAAVIAAAGFHHLMISGTPGAGKTMVAKCMSSILPPLSLEESLEVSTIYSISGLLKKETPLLIKRPFWNPHHTISTSALAGGGRNARPGIISLSHKGILFLDEFPEFGRENIEILRQPLEDKQIQISRAQKTVNYPADIMLVAAMNPCPCGYYPDRNKCRCTPMDIQRYRNRISGPILDRLDLWAEVKGIPLKTLQQGKKGATSKELRKKVEIARKMQAKRYQNTSILFNSQLKVGGIETYCNLGTKEKTYMEQLYKTLDLTARSYHRLLKVARTIADLEQSERIEKEHISEAVMFRGWER